MMTSAFLSSLSGISGPSATIPAITAPSLHHSAPHTSAGSEPVFSILGFLLSKFGIALDITKLGSLIIAASLAWSWWNSVYRLLASWANRFFWCSLEVDSTSGDSCFDQLIAWLADQPFANDNNLLSVSETKAKMEFEPWGYYRPVNMSEEEKNLEFTPACGYHRFWYKSHLIFFARYPTKKGYQKQGEAITLSTISRTPTVLKEIFYEARQAWMARDAAKTIVYREHPHCDDWQRSGARNPRPLSSIVLDEDQKTQYMRDLTDYLSGSTMRWYQSRGIPYRRGYLLHGPPGTGKSSLTFATAGAFGLPVYILNLASRRLSEDRLASLFASLPTKCILLLEDIDAAFVKRKDDNDQDEDNDNKKKKDKKLRRPLCSVSFSALLNAIDGVASSEGRILIMTTNHIDHLDPALIRDGRADLHIEFKLASCPVMAELFHRMFDSYGNDLEPVLVPVKDEDTGIVKYALEKPMVHSEEFDADELKKMSQTFANAVPDNTFSPAEIQGFLLKYKRHPKKALDAIGKWVEDVLAEREKRKRKEQEEKDKVAKDGEKKDDKKLPEISAFPGPPKEIILTAIKDAITEVVKELVDLKVQEKAKELDEITHSGGGAAGMEGQLVKSLLEVNS